MSPEKELDPKLFSLIRKVLLEDWDPVGINDIEEAQDEYNSYIPHMCNLLIQNSDVDTLANFLFYTQTYTMEVPGKKQTCREVALKLQTSYKGHI